MRQLGPKSTAVPDHCARIAHRPSVHRKNVRLANHYCYASKPILACVPSQYGLLPDAPQRHRTDFSVCSIVWPVPQQISRWPSIWMGPLGNDVTATFPARSLIGSNGFAGTSPVAAKFAPTCDPSQYGLFCDAPQRHSVTRNPASLPSTDTAA